MAKVPRADIQSEWGDLFLERDQPADALNSYRKAIELDPGWVPAHVGARARSTRCRTRSRRRAKAALEAARKLAPAHPGVLLLTAERGIDTEEFADAKQALDEFAKVRPGHHRGGRPARRDRVRGGRRGRRRDGRRRACARSIRARRRIPRSPARRPPADYRFDEAAGFARKATALDADDRPAHFDLGSVPDAHRRREGRADRARASWDLDKSAAVTKNLLDVLDRIDTFEVVPSGDFIFKFSKDEAAVLKTYALPLADEAYKTFTARYGFSPSGPILVEVFPVHDDFAVRTLGLPGLVGALGACFGRVVTMDSPRARGRRASSAGRRRCGTSSRTSSRCSCRSTACRAG